MPTFVDRHLLAQVSPAVQHQLYLEAIHGLVDASGVLPLGYWVGDGAMYCVLQAPDEQAIRQHHAERGLPCDELHLIAGVRGTWPLSEEDRRIVRAALAELWHTDRTGI